MNTGHSPGRVSVIIPTRNCAHHLARLLDSLERQTHPPDEILVVDNFSTDGTWELARQRTTAIQAGPERDVQRRLGAERATGDFLAFFDADMELDPPVLEQCLDQTVAGCDAVIIPERGGGTGFWAGCQKLEKECYWKDPWMEAANRFIRATVYRNGGGYRAGAVGWEDFDLHDRLLAAGARIGRCDAMITHHEDTRFWAVVRKKFYYGARLGPAMRLRPARNTVRYWFLKPAYFRNWRRLLRQPAHAAGLFVMKAVQNAAAALGWVSSLLRSPHSA
jgi:glycosyltransferase involved in cell wall biosynthesis